MKCKRILVEYGAKPYAGLDTYFLDNYEEIDVNRKRPVILICPGGGYRMTSDREAEAVAITYASMGYHACVLRYSVKPEMFPRALGELAWSVRYLRGHAEEYAIDEKKIYVLGFSAGGHLAASLGAFWQDKWLTELIQAEKEEIRPDGMILCYPVISSGKFGHQESFDNLLGENDTEDKRKYLSLENHVTDNFPPTFLWHTYEDETVPVENSFLMARALRKAGVSLELHIFPCGPHGLALANEETRCAATGGGIQQHCQHWPRLTDEWIREMEEKESEVKSADDPGERKGIIFDLDGVIVSTDKFHYQAWKKIADKMGIEFNEKINERLRGVSRMDSLEIILEKYKGAPLSVEKKKELAQEKNEYYVELLKTMDRCDVSEEVVDTLKSLRRKGYYLAVGSSSKNAKIILRQTRIQDLFDKVSDGTNITKSKPDPEVFLKAAEFIRIPPKECAVVEDARAGIDAAKSAGMLAVGVGTAAEYNKCDRKIRSFGELDEIF